MADPIQRKRKPINGTLKNTETFETNASQGALKDEWDKVRKMAKEKRIQYVHNED